MLSQVLLTLSDLNIDVLHWIDSSDLVFESCNNKITFQNFLECALGMRGTNRASVSDSVDLLKLIRRTDRKDEEVTESARAHSYFFA